MDRRKDTPEMIRRVAMVSLVLVTLAAPSGNRAAAQVATQRSFATAEDAVKALIAAAKAKSMDELLAIFGPDGQALLESSDAATARQNREVFTVAAAEGWRLVDQGANRKALIVGNEGWPFPVPLLKTGNKWRFDTAAGKEEVIARRIGRNELAVIDICRAYVAAQRRYAQQGHDGKPAGLFATALRSDPGKQNGLYWPTTRSQPRSPLGDLVAEASTGSQQSAADREPASPLHGYYFKTLTAQGAAAPGGAKSYIVNGDMSGGFALVAWPAQYDASGVMTFIVNQDGTIKEKDLGPQKIATASPLTEYDPDASWHPVVP